jgi:hypothetical protein
VAPLAACVGFALSRAAISRVVVGVDSAAQLEQMLVAARVTVPKVPDELACDDPELLNPSRWPKA